MMLRRKSQLFLALIGFMVLVWLVPSRSDAFPLRIGEDCFYGEGEPCGDGISTWMGYAVRFQPPYAPYTVNGVSAFIVGMQGQSTDTNPIIFKISVLDDQGICHQHKEFDWRGLRGRQGWVDFELTPFTYGGWFTVVIQSGVSQIGSINAGSCGALFLGVDTSAPGCHSQLCTEADPIFAQSRLDPSKLGNISIFMRDFPANGNWMIRAHAPGLQMESTMVEITQADIEALHAPPPLPEIPLSSRSWHMPPTDGIGPRGMVHCPTSFAGITFYPYQDSMEQKFLIPQNGPWINPNLANALGAFCTALAQEGVVGIEQLGIYNDRNIYGTNSKSSHAFGLGIDITGFKYSDGRVVMVVNHDDSATRAVLEHIRDAYLQEYFTTVLDWHYQRHNNHFHINLPYDH
jgi:hypothetical protein